MISRGAKRFNVWTDFTSKEGKKKKKRRSVCANKSILAFPFSRVSSSPSLEFSIYHSLPLYLSFRLLSVPLALPLARSSLYFVLLSHFLSLSTSRFLLRTRTSAFLTAERRSGFRRKETTIQRIVATDHSWRVDRINGVSYTNESSTGAYDTYI